MRSRRRNSKGTERGATIVEFALIGPVLFILLMGVIDFGMILNAQASVRQVTRNIARDVTIDKVDHDGVCTNAIPSPGSYTAKTKAVVCAVKKELGGDQTQTRVKVVFPNGAGQTRRDKVLVCTQQPMRSLSGMFASAVQSNVVTGAVTMRVEIEPAGTKAQSVAETPLTGANWSWCV